MLKARREAAGRRITAGEDKAYDTADHIANLRAIGVTPHVTQNQAVTKTGKNRNSAIDDRTTRHRSYGMSQSRRAMVECSVADPDLKLPSALSQQQSAP